MRVLTKRMGNFAKGRYDIMQLVRVLVKAGEFLLGQRRHLRFLCNLKSHISTPEQAEEPGQRIIVGAAHFYLKM